jgi:hypothetical protein
MKLVNTGLKKTILIVVSVIVIAVAVIIILISPIARYLAIRYGEKYTGRQIKMGLVYVNPFTGYVHISNLKIYESKNLPGYKKGDSIFFSANGVSANLALLKLFSKTIEISEATLDHPNGIIIQTKAELNFTDLIKLFTPKIPSTKPATFHFNILDIKIEEGIFRYREDVIPINYFIKEVKLESPGKRWNSDTIAVKFSFLSGPGSGSAKGNFTINFKTMEYRLSAFIQKYDLNIIEQYLKELANYGTFRANVDADITAKGNFTNQEDLTARGMVAVNDFHFGRNPEDDFVAFDKLILQINELSPKNHRYLFDSLSLMHPYIKYERYDYLDNLQRMFGENGKNITTAYADPTRFNLIFKIADYIQMLVKNFLQSYYKINRLAVYKADFKYNDFAISEKFSVAANPLFLFADSIDKNNKRLNVSLKSGIYPYGNLSVTMSINPQNTSDFDLNYHLQRLPMSIFNPYIITYTSYNLDRGTLEFNGTWNVRDAVIQSVNHLVVIDPRVTKRLRNKDARWIPMPLILAFIRERGNVIDYEIPITGNLKNPKFHLHEVLMDLLENIFVKPATTAYRLQVKNMETEIEKSLTLKWDFRQKSLLIPQEKFVKEMVDFLKKNKDASIAIYPMQYTDKEKEHILFFEAKKKYFLLSKDKDARFLSEDDTDKVNKMSVKDSLFVRYLNKQIGGNMLFTIQEKCYKYIGQAIVDAKFNQMNKDREDGFLSFFRNSSIENRIKFYPGETTIPYNGFSFYKITYKGEFPQAIIKAYQKMNELNEEAPRKKFNSDRKKVKADLNDKKVKM